MPFPYTKFRRPQAQQAAPAEPPLPNQPESPLLGRFGVEQGSPLGRLGETVSPHIMKGLLAAAPAIVKTLKSGLPPPLAAARMAIEPGWRYLSKAPDQTQGVPQDPLESTPLMGTTSATPDVRPSGTLANLPPPLGPGEVDVPRAYGGMTRGVMMPSLEGPSKGLMGSTQSALEGLRNAPQHPLLGIQEAAYGMMDPTGGGTEGRAAGMRAAQPYLDFVSESLAPQRGRDEMINAAIAGLHPAVQAGAEATAQRGAYGDVARAQGMIESAEIGADADIDEAILSLEQGDIESARALIPPHLERWIDLYEGYRSYDTPEAELIRNHILIGLQAAAKRAGL